MYHSNFWIIQNWSLNHFICHQTKFGLKNTENHFHISTLNFDVFSVLDDNSYHRRKSFSENLILTGKNLIRHKTALCLCCGTDVIKRLIADLFIFCSIHWIKFEFLLCLTISENTEKRVNTVRASAWQHVGI